MQTHFEQAIGESCLNRQLSLHHQTYSRTIQCNLLQIVALLIQVVLSVPAGPAFGSHLTKYLKHAMLTHSQRARQLDQWTIASKYAGVVEQAMYIANRAAHMTLKPYFHSESDTVLVPAYMIVVRVLT